MSTLNYISYLFKLWCHLCYTCSDRLWYHLSCHTYNYCSDSGVHFKLYIILVQTLVSLMLYLFRSTLVSLIMSNLYLLFRLWCHLSYYTCSDSGVTYIILVQTLVSLIVLVQIDSAWYHLSYRTYTCSDSGVTHIILSLVQPLVSLISYLVLFNLWCHLSCILYTKV